MREPPNHCDCFRLCLCLSSGADFLHPLAPLVEAVVPEATLAERKAVTMNTHGPLVDDWINREYRKTNTIKQASDYLASHASCPACFPSCHLLNVLLHDLFVLALQVNAQFCEEGSIELARFLRADKYAQVVDALAKLDAGGAWSEQGPFNKRHFFTLDEQHGKCNETRRGTGLCARRVLMCLFVCLVPFIYCSRRARLRHSRAVASVSAFVRLRGLSEAPLWAYDQRAVDRDAQVLPWLLHPGLRRPP